MRGERRSERNADDGQFHALCMRHPQNVAGLRAKCETDADFMRALRNRMRNDTVDAQCGKGRREGLHWGNAFWRVSG
jgi:hypothetical protein